MATDTGRRPAGSGSASSGTAPLEVGAERTLDRRQAYLKALQSSSRARRASPRRELRRHDLRETWFRLLNSDSPNPTPEES
ncbi:hypothetical protein ACFU96_40940 [Streptomyces sp. NPDC057620]|uniref:hypothetical protein n=1 Tax=Streptomyces sp. NPDC057620 TaxID=3346185 RepID=UPI0036AA5C6E